MGFPDSFQQRNYYCGDYDCPTRHKIDTNSDRQTAAAHTTDASIDGLRPIALWSVDRCGADVYVGSVACVRMNFSVRRLDWHLDPPSVEDRSAAKVASPNQLSGQPAPGTGAAAVSSGPCEARWSARCKFFAKA
jgi:hypothetical protein